MKFVIPKMDTFDIRQTLECGQVFRCREEGDGFVVFAQNHRAFFSQTTDGTAVDCDDEVFFRKYLDFDTNYDIIQLKSQDKGLVSSAIEFGKGIRILKQNFVETVFSFIVSQNNHIPRIKSIIERICTALGEDMDGYHAFPTVDALASVDEEWYKTQGAGYRAEYLALTARRFRDEGIPSFDGVDTETARKILTSYKGIGRKVADCILLFGLGRQDVFPVDTWILKVFADEYPDVPAEKLSRILVEKYGDYSGYVQQWLFYFKREQKKL